MCKATLRAQNLPVCFDWTHKKGLERMIHLKQIRTALWSPHEIMHALVEHNAENNNILSMITLPPLIFTLDPNSTIDPFIQGGY